MSPARMIACAIIIEEKNQPIALFNPGRPKPFSRRVWLFRVIAVNTCINRFSWGKAAFDHLGDREFEIVMPIVPVVGAPRPCLGGDFPDDDKIGLFNQGV